VQRVSDKLVKVTAERHNRVSFILPRELLLCQGKKDSAVTIKLTSKTVGFPNVSFAVGLEKLKCATAAHWCKKLETTAKACMQYR